MRKLPAVMCGVLAAAVFLFVLTGCPQEAVEDPVLVYGFDLNTAEYQYYISSSAFVPAEAITVRISNTGNQTLQGMKAELRGDDWELFSLDSDLYNRQTTLKLSDVEVGGTTSFKIYPPQMNLGAVLAKPSIRIGNANVTHSFQITYGVADAAGDTAADVTFNKEAFFAGDTITASAAGKSAESPWVIFGDVKGLAAVVDQAQGSIKLLSSGDVFIGYITNEDPPVMKAKKVSILENAPIVTSFTQTDNIARVVFDRMVNINPARILVKASDVPRGDISGGASFAADKATLDLFPARTWPAVATKVGEDGTTYDLTLWDLANPPNYGEILRLVIEKGGAATLGLSFVVPEIILKNPVQRVKENFEVQAGLYRNGVRHAISDTAEPNKLFEESMKVLSAYTNIPGEEEVVHIVLETDQDYNIEQITNNLMMTAMPSNKGQLFSWIYVTKKTGLVTDVKINVTGIYYIQIGGSLTYVIEDGIVFDGTNAVDRYMPMFFVDDGGRIILDGGEVNNFQTSTGVSEYALQSAFAVGGGNWGAFLIINDGKISGNRVMTDHDAPTGSSPAVGSSTITTRQHGFVVMHGGEISNNKVIRTTPAGANMIAAAISSGNGLSRQGSFYMTGGEIFGNTVEADGAVASAGAVLITGAFQKTGGNIYGSDAAAGQANSTSVTGGNVKASAVVVVNADGANPAAAWKRENTSGPTDYLFVDSYRSSMSTGVNTLPIWWGGVNVWD